MTATEGGIGAPGRARMTRAVQGTMGNAHISRTLGTAVQAKLTVGAPNDRYEQEADRTADKVMRMPEPPRDRQEETTPPGGAPLQRQIVNEEEPGAGGVATARRQMHRRD